MKMRSIIIILLILVAPMIAMNNITEQGKEPESLVPTEPPDTDNDGMNDWFEENVTDLDPNVPNKRYLLDIASEDINPEDTFLTPFEPISYIGGWINGSRYILMKNGFDPENIIQLVGEEATSQAFEREVIAIATKVTKNDTVFIQLTGHGSSQGFNFYNEQKTYENIDEVIDRIVAKKVIISIASCGSGNPEAIKPLIQGPCLRVVMAAHEFTQYCNIASGFWHRVIIRTIDNIDTDNNRHISIRENWIARTEIDYKVMSKDNEKNWSYSLEENNGSLFCKIWSEEHQGFYYYTFLDTGNIGKHTYIGDATIEELKEKPNT